MVELTANRMLFLVYIVVGVFITSIIVGTWGGWRIIRNDPDLERVKLKIELLKSFFSGLGTLILACSLITGIFTYLQERDKLEQQTVLDREKQNSEQFKTAIAMLNSEKGQLSAAEGSIIILDNLNKIDPKTFLDPSRNVLRASLIDLQNMQSQNYIINIGVGLESTRYNRLLSSYTHSYELGEIPEDRFADFTFLRASGLDIPPLKGVRGNFYGSYLRKALFERKNFSNANFDQADLTDAQLQLGVFEHATFRQTQLLGASFVGANLARSDFTGAILINTRFYGANMDCANLRGADLTGAEVDLQTLVPAYIAPETRLPNVISREVLLKEQKRRKVGINCWRDSVNNLTDIGVVE